MSKKINRKDYEIVTKQQRRFIEKSCIDFDKGDEAEGIRIAGHLRTFLHDSYIKKNFDSKLINIASELRNTIATEIADKKLRVNCLNKIDSIKHKIEQQQKKQILSKSLLTQIGLKNIKFIDTSIPPGSFAFYTIGNGLQNTTIIGRSYYGLLAKNITISDDHKETVTYSPLCSHPSFSNYLDQCQWLEFEEWWHKYIYDDGMNVRFSRKDLVQVVANQDGYAHVEENIDLEYIAFKQANILENFINNNKKATANMATLNSIRQIAFETLFSIDKS